MRREGFVVESISLNALRRKSISFKTIRGLGSLCDKNQEFRDEEVYEKVLKFKFTISVQSKSKLVSLRGRFLVNIYNYKIRLFAKIVVVKVICSMELGEK